MGAGRAHSAAVVQPSALPAVVKRVALAHGIAAADFVPLPRLNRAELAALGRAGVSRERARRAVPRGR